jgi:Flp pilus assembly protein TadG
MRGTIFSRLRAGASNLFRDQRGNAMMLTAAAIVPVVGIVGSAVDIGRAYMTQLRLQQACDAGVLAGRRAMAGALYTDPAKTEANKMFNFNFPDGNFGSHAVSFSSWGVGSSDVAGRATAILPTALMYIFGKDQFDLAANCTAKLEISNVDVMMVLDVTGSMARKADSDDDDTKIEALRKAAIDFFDTLTNADVGDGRIRFGVVPYSSSVNVGQILYAANPDWLADQVTLPSRVPNFTVTFGNASTEVSDIYTDGTTTAGNWNSGSNVDKSLCSSGATPPPDTTPTTGSNKPTRNQTAQYVDGDGNRITTYDKNQKYTYYNYQYVMSGSKCKLQERTMTFTRTYKETVTEEPIQNFKNYTYQNRSFDVSYLKAGTTLVTNTGNSGANANVSWSGCIIERGTTAFASNKTAPSDAYDMDIDLVPDASDDDTRWKLFLPDVTYDRSQTNSVTTTSNYKNFVDKGGDYAACPAAAMKLETMTKSDHDRFAAYINTLQPKGYTYHDAGMAWGARLLSPSGLFADENGPYNGRPVSRHVIFMTDGDMMTPRDNLSHQGQERSMPRIGATSDDDAIARHNNRFVQLCRAARQRAITIWVVSFGVGSNANLNSCASSGQAFEASNASQLNDQFQAIARQISKLRLSQ